MKDKLKLALNLIADLAGASMLQNREEHDNICSGVQESAQEALDGESEESNIHKTILRVITTEPWDPCDICVYHKRDTECEYQDDCENNFRVRPSLLANPKDT